MGAVLAYIAHLYKVEKQARRSGIVGTDLRLLREQASKPVLEQLRRYLPSILLEVVSGAIGPRASLRLAIPLGRKCEMDQSAETEVDFRSYKTDP
jgi:hypothetical protein